VRAPLKVAPAVVSRLLRRLRTRGAGSSRPIYRPGELPREPAQAWHSERRIDELSLIVFDTETTGLRPSAGDEIVQVAGVRVESGRLVAGERFNELINPGRAIPPASTRLHGIDKTAVAGRPAPPPPQPRHPAPGE